MLIIDGDLFVYKAGFAHRKKELGFKLVNKESNDTVIDLGNLTQTEAVKAAKERGISSNDWHLTPYYEPIELSHVLGNLKHTLTQLMENFDNIPYELYLTSTDHSNYRYNIATITPYKGSRSRCTACYSKTTARYDDVIPDFMGIGALKQVVLNCPHCGDIPKEQTKSERPYYFEEIREYMINQWGAIVVEGEEADDVVSYRSIELTDEGLTPIMVHIDKDINNTQGWHFNPDTKEGYYINPTMAMRNFYSQVLLGDKIDCIPGVNGCGPKTIDIVFQYCDNPLEYEEVILNIFQGEHYDIPRFSKAHSMCLTKQEAWTRLREIGQLLHIRQSRGEMWQPVTERIE